MNINIQPFIDMKLKQMTITSNVSFMSTVFRSQQFKDLGTDISEALAGSLAGFAQKVPMLDAAGSPVLDSTGAQVMKIETEWEVMGRMAGSSSGMDIMASVIKAVVASMG